MATYESIQETARILNIAATNIVKVLKNKYRHCNKFVFYYHDGNIIPKCDIIFRIYPNFIFQTDNNGELLRLFKNMRHAHLETGINETTIRKICDSALNVRREYHFIKGTKELLKNFKL